MTHGEGVSIHKDKVIKRFKGDISYNKELNIYKKRLSYIPKLISYDDDKREIVISKECCETFSQFPVGERSRYYPKIKQLYYRFKKDTGFYLYDFSTKNIIIDKKNNQLKLIDFEYYGKEKDIWKSVYPFLKKSKII